MRKELEEGTLLINFIPVFDNRTGMFNTLYCRPALRKHDGSRLDDADFLSMGSVGKAFDEALLVRNMKIVVGAGLRKAERLAAETSDTKVITPICGVALAHKSVAAEFTKLCHSASQKGRSNIIFEVTSISDRQKMSFIDEIAILLLPFCAACQVRVPLSAVDIKMFAACRYAGISVDLQNKPWPLDVVGGHMKTFFTRTESSGLKLYVHGIGNQSLAGYLRGVGARFLSGKGVVDAPSKATDANDDFMCQ